MWSINTIVCKMLIVHVEKVKTDAWLFKIHVMSVFALSTTASCVIQTFSKKNKKTKIKVTDPHACCMKSSRGLSHFTKYRIKISLFDNRESDFNPNLAADYKTLLASLTSVLLLMWPPAIVCRHYSLNASKWWAVLLLSRFWNATLLWLKICSNIDGKDCWKLAAEISWEFNREWAQSAWLDIQPRH